LFKKNIIKSNVKIKIKKDTQVNKVYPWSNINNINNFYSNNSKNDRNSLPNNNNKLESLTNTSFKIQDCSYPVKSNRIRENSERILYKSKSILDREAVSPNINRKRLDFEVSEFKFDFKSNDSLLLNTKLKYY